MKKKIKIRDAVNNICIVSIRDYATERAALSTGLTVIMCRRSRIAVLVILTLIYPVTGRDRKSHATGTAGSSAGVVYDRKSRPAEIVVPPRVRRFIIGMPRLPRLYRGVHWTRDIRGHWRPTDRPPSPLDRFYKLFFSALRRASARDKIEKSEEDDFF